MHHHKTTRIPKSSTTTTTTNNNNNKATVPNDPPSYANMDLPQYSKPTEKLPTYKSSLQFYGLSLIKTEFLTPYQSNEGSRNWRPIVLELNSNQLNMYSLNVPDKLLKVIVQLYHEHNNLEEVFQELRSNTNVASLLNQNDDGDSGDLNSEFDLFDAYGSNESSSSSSGPFTGFSKFKANLKHNIKHSKKHLHSNVEKFYNVMQENQLLFEPVDKYETFIKFKSKYQGQLLYSYTLSNLHLGQAPSLQHLISIIYKQLNHFDHNDQSDFNLQDELNSKKSQNLVKYKNTLRLRIEYKQILLQFWSFYGMIHWFRMLTIGKDLSRPLECRTITRLKSIPYRYLSRNNEFLAANAAAATLRRRSHQRHEHGEEVSEVGGEDGDDEGDEDEPYEYEFELFRDGMEICFNDSFRNGGSNNSGHINKVTPPPPAACTICRCQTPTSTASSSLTSSRDSLFERRESISSVNSSIQSLTPPPSTSIASHQQSSTSLSSCKYSINLHNLKFISYEKYFSNLEKQYIANCIPDLNSFDKWDGKHLTISNFNRFADDEQSMVTARDLFIGYNSLTGLVSNYDRLSLKKSGSWKHGGQTDNGCRTFLIHQTGLVSVAQR